MSKTEQNSIQVDVKTAYIEEQSNPVDDSYVFAYTITIRNTGATSARLISRHWLITDANGGIQEVFGEGVVGEQPYLRPGEDFSYTSGTSLPTPVGTMQEAIRCAQNQAPCLTRRLRRFLWPFHINFTDLCALHVVEQHESICYQ